LNLSDKDLDRLSREAAGQFEIDENISSWEKLEQELDKEFGPISNNPAPRPGIVAVGYISLVLLVACLSFFLFKNDKTNKDSTLSGSIASATSKKTPPASSVTMSTKQPGDVIQKAKNKLVATKDNLTVSSSNQRTPASSLEKGRLDNPGNLTQQKARALAVSPRDRAIDQIVATGNSKQTEKDMGIDGLQKYSKDRVMAGKSSAENNFSKKQTSVGITVAPSNAKSLESVQNTAPVPETDKIISENSSENARGIADKPILGQSNDARQHTKTIGLPALEPVAAFNQRISDSSLRAFASKANSINEATAQAVKKNQQPLQINRSLKIGILAAPDFTNVGNAYNDKMSSNFGLTLGYYLFNNFSVNTGIIFTRKNYAANGYDFHSANQWFNMIQLDYIQGSCNMLEIPLTIRYDYSIIGKTKFFINGGLSSYLMKHESYVYYYHTNGYAGQTMKDYDNHNNYLFSTVSLSIGVEQQFSNSFSLQVEPFVKLPISGIGYGNLQLTSYGLAFSLRFSPVLGKSRH
jgi:Outer membrane protein beta-barrel domain